MVECEGTAVLQKSALVARFRAAGPAGEGLRAGIELDVFAVRPHHQGDPDGTALEHGSQLAERLFALALDSLALRDVQQRADDPHDSPLLGHRLALMKNDALAAVVADDPVLEPIGATVMLCFCHRPQGLFPIVGVPHRGQRPGRRGSALRADAEERAQLGGAGHGLVS